MPSPTLLSRKAEFEFVALIEAVGFMRGEEDSEKRGVGEGGCVNFIDQAVHIFSELHTSCQRTSVVHEK